MKMNHEGVRRIYLEIKTMARQRLDLAQLIQKLQDALIPDPELMRSARETMDTLNSVLRNIRVRTKSIDANGRKTYTETLYQDVELLLFGSTRGHVGTPESDLDMCAILKLDQEVEDREIKIAILEEMKAVLLKRERNWGLAEQEGTVRFEYGTIHVRRIRIDHPGQRKAPPILTCKTQDGMAIDMCIEDLDGPLGTELVRTAKARGGRIFHAMFVTLKVVGKTFNILDSKHQYPSATNLFFLVLYYLQAAERIFGPVNVKAMKFNDDLKILKDKFVKKGDWEYLDKKFLLQANYGGWTKLAEEAMQQEEDTPSDVLPRRVNLDQKIVGQSKEETLKSLLIGFGDWLGSGQVPRVVDVSHPIDQSSHPNSGKVTDPVQILCAPLHYCLLEGKKFIEFRLAYQRFSKLLVKSPLMIPIAPKTGRRLGRPERIQLAKEQEQRIMGQ